MPHTVITLRRLDHLSAGIKVLGAIVVGLLVAALLSMVWVAWETAQQLRRQQASDQALTRSVIRVLSDTKLQAQRNGQAVALIEECIRPTPPGQPPTECVAEATRRQSEAVHQIVVALDADGTRVTLARIEALLRRIERAMAAMPRPAPAPPAPTTTTAPHRNQTPVPAPEGVCLTRPEFKC